jgi:hypothetical protein
MIQVPLHSGILILYLPFQVRVANGAKPRRVLEVFEFPFKIL